MSIRGNGGPSLEPTPDGGGLPVAHRYGGARQQALPPSWGPPLTGREGKGGAGGTPPPSRRRRRLTALATVAVIMATIAAGALAGHIVWQTNEASTGAIHTPATPSTGSGAEAKGGPADAGALASKISSALVDIDTVMGYAGEEGAGTGMVLTSGGEVLTNNHVIEGATSLNVTDVGDHRTYRATVVGYDPTQDIALLQMTGAAGLRTIASGNSSQVRVGQGVVTVGNGGGVGGTPSYAGGELVATGQTITAEDSANGTTEKLSDLLETNAPVVPGDSGGPLLDTQGQVIGMVTAGTSGFQFEDVTNQAFAIQISRALTIGRQIAQKKPSPTVHIGPTPFLGVSVGSNPEGAGVVVVQAVPGGPAAAAGLTFGDQIISFNTRTISTPENLTNLLLNQSVGARVTLTYLDLNGQRHTVQVQLGSGPPQ